MTVLVIAFLYTVCSLEVIKKRENFMDTVFSQKIRKFYLQNYTVGQPFIFFIYSVIKWSQKAQYYSLRLKVKKKFKLYATLWIICDLKHF